MALISRRGGVALVAVLFGLLPLAVAHAADAPPAWVARHDLTSTAYAQALKDNANLRLVSVSGYTVGKSLRFAALWRQLDGAKQVESHNLTSSAYQKLFTAQAKAGYRLTYVTGYAVGSSPRFAAVWEKRSGPAYLARHNLPFKAYERLFKTATKKGYRLLHVSGYAASGKARYAAIFEKSDGPAWVSHSALSNAQLQSKYKQYIGQGYTLQDISGYSVGGKDRYAAIWRKVPGPRVRARNGIPRANYQRTIDNDRLQAFYPVFVNGFSSGSSARMNIMYESALSGTDRDAIDNAAKGWLKNRGVPGLSIAIAKDGRLVYASGYGSADSKNKVAMDAFHRLRIGSVSKTITSTAAYRLVEEKVLPSIHVNVLGQGGLLGSSAPAGFPITVPDDMADLKGADLRQFLDHSAGLPGQAATPSGGGGVPFQADRLGDPIDCQAGSLSNRIGVELERHSKASKARGVPPLIGKPGERYDYQNLDTNIVERTIERVTGLQYDAWVRLHVLQPAGVTAARLFKVDSYDPKTGEAKFYQGPGDASPYYAKNEYCEGKPPGTGAGGWAMSARDLLRFFTKVRSLLPTTYDDSVTAPTLKTGTSTYAGSWILRPMTWCTLKRDVTIGHNGSVRGAHSEMFELKNGYSFALLANSRYTSCDDAGASAIIPVMEKIDWPSNDLF